MPRKPIGSAAMTDAERQARCREARTAGKPAHRPRQPTDRRSRVQQWRDAVAQLTELQKSYAAWFDTLPDNLRDTTTAEALQAICDIDLADLQAVEPPRGFGRD